MVCLSILCLPLLRSGGLSAAKKTNGIIQKTRQEGDEDTVRTADSEG